MVSRSRRLYCENFTSRSWVLIGLVLRESETVLLESPSGGTGEGGGILLLENKGSCGFGMDHQKEQMLRLGKNSHPIHKGWSLYGSVQSSPLPVSDLKVVEELQRLDEGGMHLHNSA